MSTFDDSLEREWEQGLLQELERDLEQFVRKNAEKIRAALKSGELPLVKAAEKLRDTGKVSDREMVDICVRSLLRKCGTVNAKRDLELQCRQIRNEIWYEGERMCGPVPEPRQEEIARTWAHLHAAKWREWRLREIIFTWEKKLPEFIQIILERGTTRTRERDTTTRRRHA
jgi:hypothetical protein